MTEAFLLLLALLALAALLRANSGRPLVQLYAAIVVSYLNLFPSFDQLLTLQPATTFLQTQLLVILFFELPLFFLLATRDGKTTPPSFQYSMQGERLRAGVPLLLLALLALFWIIAIRYEQFFVRLGYDAFIDNPNLVPGFLLYPYRLVVESSYFIILYLIFCLHLSSKTAPLRSAYKITLALYLCTFIAFFFINSRMQFLLLLLCLYFVRPSFAAPRLRLLKITAIASIGVALVLVLTLVREFYIESNNRLDPGDSLNLLHAVSSLVAGRLNSLVMLNRAMEEGYNPFGTQFSGLEHFWNMYFSFIADQKQYEIIRASEITSPSVEIVNRLLNESHVDFPKSMILDIQLIFGALGLPVLAFFLSTGVRYAQRSINASRVVTRPLLVSLFVTPLLLQFEKESLGLISFLFKWSPLLLLLLLIHAPRRRKRLGNPPYLQSMNNHPSSAHLT